MKMKRGIRRKREERDGRVMRGVVREELMREEGVDREIRQERN